MLKENLREVEGRVEAACKRAGRDVSEVTLIAVSKTKPVEDLQEILANVILAKIKYRNCVQRWKLCHRTSSGI